MAEETKLNQEQLDAMQKALVALLIVKRHKVYIYELDRVVAEILGKLEEHDITVQFIKR